MTHFPHPIRRLSGLGAAAVRAAITSVLTASLLVLATPVHAQGPYVPPEPIPVHYEDLTFSHPDFGGKLTQILGDEVEDALVAGLKSVGEQILSTVGEALISVYAPAIADMLFGGDPLEAATQRILDEIQTTHSDLADRHRDLLDEIQAQYNADIEALLDLGSLNYSAWLANGSHVARHGSLDVLLLARQDLNEAALRIENYIADAPHSDPAIQSERLQLLPIQIMAAQLGVQADAHYWSVRAIQNAFDVSVYGGAPNQYATWAASLTPDDWAAIQADVPPALVVQRDVVQRVTNFYAQVAAADVYSAYLDGAITPVVSPATKLAEGNHGMWDVPAVVTNINNWVPPSGAVPILDNHRWYYYIAIPNQDCLDPWAYDALDPNHGIPWAEDPASPTRSDCGRFWISQAGANVDEIFGSFDGYNVRFGDPDDMLAVHRQLAHGDLVRMTYGPASLVLDSMHRAFLGSERPPNAWDDVFVEYDEQIAMLGASDRYDEAVVGRNVLDLFGVDSRRLGIADYAASLAAAAPPTDSQASFGLYIAWLARNGADWMDPTTALNELSARDARLALLGEDSLRAQLLAGADSGALLQATEAQMHDEAVAKLMVLF